MMKNSMVSEHVEENVNLIVEKIIECLNKEHPWDRGLKLSQVQIEALLNPQGEYLSLTLFLYLNYIVQNLRKPQDLDFNDYRNFLMGELANSPWEVEPLMSGELDSIHDRFLYGAITSIIITPLRYQVFIARIFHECLEHEQVSFSQNFVYDIVDQLISFHHLHLRTHSWGVILTEASRG